MSRGLLDATWEVLREGEEVGVEVGPDESLASLGLGGVGASTSSDEDTAPDLDLISGEGLVVAAVEHDDVGVALDLDVEFPVSHLSLCHEPDCFDVEPIAWGITRHVSLVWNGLGCPGVTLNPQAGKSSLVDAQARIEPAITPS